MAAVQGVPPRLRVLPPESEGQSFEDFFGESLTTLDNMADRSPEAGWRSPAA